MSKSRMKKISKYVKMFCNNPSDVNINNKLELLLSTSKKDFIHGGGDEIDKQVIKYKDVRKNILDMSQRINSLNEQFISYRDSLEIDVYLPELKIGFEFNGLYWHSEECKDKNYHLNKTNYFKEKGIRIIHIWEDDWDFKRSIIESQIKNWIQFS